MRKSGFNLNTFHLGNHFIAGDSPGVLFFFSSWTSTWRNIKRFMTQSSHHLDRCFFIINNAWSWCQGYKFFIYYYKVSIRKILSFKQMIWVVSSTLISSKSAPRSNNISFCYIFLFIISGQEQLQLINIVLRWKE